MFKNIRGCTALLPAGVFLALSAQLALAQVSDPVLTISATNAQGTASVSFNNADGVQNGNVFTLAAPGQTLTSGGGQDIATMTMANLTANGNLPRLMSMNFAFVAGQSDTTFTISTGLFSFGALNSPPGIASTSYTLTDSDSDGAVFTANGRNGHASLVNYNGLIPAGTAFGDYISSFAVGPAGSAPSTGGGPGATVGSVTSMSLRSMFTLSAGDQVSGNLTFVLTPEPAMGLLIGLGFLLSRPRR